MKKTNNLKDPKDEQPGNDCENIPAAGFGQVDNILYALVNRSNTDNDDYSVLTQICCKVVKKALKGDIEACRLVFDRISGYSVLPIITVEKETNLSVDKERDIETEVGFS